MEITVLFVDAARRAASTFSSVAESRFAVISSNSRILGLAATALAIESSCICPCENRPAVHRVSYPFSRSALCPHGLSCCLSSLSALPRYPGPAGMTAPHIQKALFFGHPGSGLTVPRRCIPFRSMEEISPAAA